MKWTNQIAIWAIACCFYTYNIGISIFLFVIFFGSALVYKLPKTLLVLIVLIGLWYLFYVIYLPNLKSFDFLYNFVNKLFNQDIRLTINNYFLKIHNNTIGSFLSLVLLNIKNQYNNKLYYELVDLSIVHLIVISGYHVNLLCLFFKKVFWKFPFLGNYISLLIAFFITYLNGFSSSTIRILFTYFFYCFNRTKFYGVNLSIISISLIAPKTITSLGLCMSFLGARGIKVFTKIACEGSLYENLFSSFFATLYILPFISQMNDNISLWAIFYSLLFTPIFMLLYFFSFLLCWFNNLDQILNIFYLLIFNSSKILNNINVYVPISYMNNTYFFIPYYSTLEIVNLLLIKERKKEKWKLKTLLKK